MTEPPNMTDPLKMLQRLEEAFERERLEAAERNLAAYKELEWILSDTRARAMERENDLLDIVRECWEALREAIPLAEGGCKLPLRTIAARAEDALRHL